MKPRLIFIENSWELPAMLIVEAAMVKRSTAPRVSVEMHAFYTYMDFRSLAVGQQVKPTAGTCQYTSTRACVDCRSTTIRMYDKE